MNKFWILGTNPSVYINNYVNLFSGDDVGSTFRIKNLMLTNDLGTIKKTFGSKATLKQNLICWESFRFIVKINELQFVIIRNIKSYDDALSVAKNSILVSADDEKTSLFLNTIAQKIFYLLFGFKGLEDLSSSRRKDLVKETQIKKEVGRFEKELLLDKNFIKKLLIIKDV